MELVVRLFTRFFLYYTFTNLNVGEMLKQHAIAAVTKLSRAGFRHNDLKMEHFGVFMNIANIDVLAFDFGHVTD